MIRLLCTFYIFCLASFATAIEAEKIAATIPNCTHVFDLGSEGGVIALANKEGALLTAPKVVYFGLSAMKTHELKDVSMPVDGAGIPHGEIMVGKILIALAYSNPLCGAKPVLRLYDFSGFDEFFLDEKKKHDALSRVLKKNQFIPYSKELEQDVLRRFYLEQLDVAKDPDIKKSAQLVWVREGYTGSRRADLSKFYVIRKSK